MLGSKVGSKNLQVQLIKACLIEAGSFKFGACLDSEPVYTPAHQIIPVRFQTLNQTQQPGSIVINVHVWFIELPFLALCLSRDDVVAANILVFVVIATACPLTVSQVSSQALGSVSALRQ